MRLDRYTGQAPKFQVLRRVDHTTNDVPVGERIYEIDGALYRRMSAFDYFVLALKDQFAASALAAYAMAAAIVGEDETAADVRRLAEEAAERTDRKIPD